MRRLLDTHILLWAAADSERLPAEARALIEDPLETPVFSVASLWEVVIKQALGRPDFGVDARALRHGLLENGYEEMAIVGAHVLAVADLPPLHKDPFDRLLVAQAMTEGIELLTANPLVAAYPGPIRRV
jgi:PIN domain nuclease of toxin-antitoxin system